LLCRNESTDFFCPIKRFLEIYANERNQRNRTEAAAGFVQQGVWRYWGMTLLTSTSTTWQLLFGLDKHRQAFYLILYISNVAAAVPGGRFSNPPTTPSPQRYRKLYSPEIG
jgi:hypothetical protein